MAEAAARRREIEAHGTQLAFLTMADDATAGALLARYGLSDVAHVSDPSQTLYRALGLRRGGLRQLFNFGVMRRGLQASLAGHRQGRIVGDAMRLGGAFLIRDGHVVRAFRNRDVADRADYCELART